MSFLKKLAQQAPKSTEISELSAAYIAAVNGGTFDLEAMEFDWEFAKKPKKPDDVPLPPNPCPGPRDGYYMFTRQSFVQDNSICRPMPF